MITMPHLPKLALQKYIDSGYLHAGSSLDELARSIGVDARGLEQTVKRYNTFAKTGIDEDFHKGELLFGQAAGDPDNKPNPNVGPIKKGPFYAIAVVPTLWPLPLASASTPTDRLLVKMGSPSLDCTPQEMMPNLSWLLNILVLVHRLVPE